MTLAIAWSSFTVTVSHFLTITSPSPSEINCVLMSHKEHLKKSADAAETESEWSVPELGQPGSVPINESGFPSDEDE